MLKEHSPDFTNAAFASLLPTERQSDAVGLVADFKIRMERVTSLAEVVSVVGHFREKMIALYLPDLTALMQLWPVFWLMESYGAHVMITRLAMASLAKTGKA
ncbi:hypothetical protein KBB08_00220 [Candidatus Gracilibacteria bacterium]|nr:hypothetical protein [Candidatus Gracilibacteria bacterium]